MKHRNFLHGPTLGNVLLAEKTIADNSGELGKDELWQRLKGKPPHESFLIILDYLESTNHIVFDRDGQIVWIWNPSPIRRLERKGLRHWTNE